MTVENWIIINYIFGTQLHKLHENLLTAQKLWYLKSIIIIIKTTQTPFPCTLIFFERGAGHTFVASLTMIFLGNMKTMWWEMVNRMSITCNNMITIKFSWTPQKHYASQVLRIQPCAKCSYSRPTPPRTPVTATWTISSSLPTDKASRYLFRLVSRITYGALPRNVRIARI